MLRHKSHFTASISSKLINPNLYNLFFKRSLTKNEELDSKEKMMLDSYLAT